MAKSSTTHVIEIETGIGEPAFIPLTLGQELQPISVGKKGMWRIESARVLDVHAFVYFDGTSLFLQSADENASASVDGYRVGKAWTELHAPCKIEIGAARLRFRSLLPNANQAPRPPSIAPPGAGPSAGPRAAATGPVEPVSFPKADRPFNNTAPPPEGARAVSVDGPAARASPGSLPPRPAASREVDEDNPTRMEGGGARGVPLNRTANMPAVTGSPMGITPVQAIPPGMQPARMQAALQQNMQAMQPGMMQPGMMQPGMMQPGMMQPGMMPAPGSGGYAPYPGAPYNGPGGSGGYGSMDGAQGAPGAAIPYFVAKYKSLSPAKRILVILAPFCLVTSGYLLFFEDSPRPSRRAAVDAGIEASVFASTPPQLPPAIPPTVPSPSAQPACPPGFVPYSIPVGPGGAIPCVPAGTPMPPGPAAQPPPPPAPPPTPAVVDAGLPTAVVGGNKTLERQAVDFVAVNDYARAALVYEQLQQQNPSNRVYAEAARILRAKADAGVP